MWFIACLPCVMLWIWAKILRWQRRLQVHIGFICFCLRLAASDSWQEPGSKSHITRRVAGLSYAMNKNRMSRISSGYITLDTSQEHSSHKDRRKWTVGLTGYLGRAAGEADLQSLKPQPCVCWALALICLSFILFSVLVSLSLPTDEFLKTGSLAVGSWDYGTQQSG